jgi:uncharacterized protein (TIGR02452 family)
MNTKNQFLPPISKICIIINTHTISMNNRNQRKAIAEETLKIIEQGYFLTQEGVRIDIKNQQWFAEQHTVVYTPKMTEQLIQERRSQPLTDQTTQIKVINDTTLNATRQLIKAGHEDVLCLNFASAKKPGGGFLGGSQAQEESLARATGLYNCLLKANEYYETNRQTKSCFYTDYMIYAPGVPIIKDENGNNLDELTKTAIITAPAVNTGIVKQREFKRLNEIEVVMKTRMEKVLSIALENKHLNIVLGAWGCGVFANEPTAIAKYFKWVIDHKFNNEFEKIIFAVYSKNQKIIEPFYHEFS